MTVAENIGFHLKITKVEQAERNRRVHEAAEILDLDEYLDRKPAKLSGGQRQRVAMGRAIVREPQVFLMDEPLSNLDAKLRVQTRTQIAALQRRLGVTTVYVTHDQVEAMTMGDRVAVLKDGVLQQCAPPRELFKRPGEPVRRRLHRVAGDEPAVGDRRPTPGRPGRLADGAADRGPAIARPRRRGLDRRPPRGLHDGGTRAGLDCTVDLVEELGSESYLYCTASDADARPGRRPDRGAQLDADEVTPSASSRARRLCTSSTLPPGCACPTA